MGGIKPGYLIIAGAILYGINYFDREVIKPINQVKETITTPYNIIDNTIKDIIGIINPPKLYPPPTNGRRRFRSKII